MGKNNSSHFHCEIPIHPEAITILLPAIADIVHHMKFNKK